MKAATLTFLVVCCMSGVAAHAFADPPKARTSLEAAPEPLPAGSYWFPGMLAGGLVGLGAGYLQERDGDHELTSDKWKKIGIWGGSGAAAGLVLGLMFYGADRNDEEQRQEAYVVMRDLVSGTIIGTVVGGSVGVIYDGATSGSEHALYGASIGAVAGAGLGFLVGLVELGSKEEKPTARRITPMLTSMRDGRNRPTWLMGASGRF